MGIGGKFVDSEHTASHYRDELLLSPFFDQQSWGAGNSLDKERFEKLARQKVLDLMAEDGATVLNTDQVAAIDEIVAEAQSKLG